MNVDHCLYAWKKTARAHDSRQLLSISLSPSGVHSTTLSAFSSNLSIYSIVSFILLIFSFFSICHSLVETRLDGLTRSSEHSVNLFVVENIHVLLLLQWDQRYKHVSWLNTVHEHIFKVPSDRCAYLSALHIGCSFIVVNETKIRKHSYKVTYH